jgi:hypothetical protein
LKRAPHVELRVAPQRTPHHLDFGLAELGPAGRSPAKRREAIELGGGVRKGEEGSLRYGVVDNDRKFRSTAGGMVSRDNVVRIPAPSLHRNDAGLAAITRR